MKKMVSYRKYVLTAVLALSLTALSCSPLTMVSLGSRGAETPLEVAKIAPLRQPFDGAQDRTQDSATATPIPASPLPATTLKVGVAEEEDLLINLYERVNPAVVNIRVVKRVEQPAVLTPDEFYQEGQGSGFVWDQEGHIVTNNHVVEGADEVEVVFWDDTVVEGKVIGTDPDSDLAVVEVDLPAEELHLVKLGTRMDSKWGNWLSPSATLLDRRAP